MSVRIPKYRLHKPTGQALVEIRGKRTYLGRHGSPESKEKYRRIIAEFVSNNGEVGPDLPPWVTPVAKLTLGDSSGQPQLLAEA